MTKMTKLKFINLFLLQWFFIRAVKCQSENHYWFAITFFVLPLTGWSGSYVRLNKTVFVPISKKFTNQEKNSK